MTTLGQPMGWADKIGMACIIVAMGFLFVALTQPAWRGDEMLAEMRDDCQKVGGVMLEHKRMFGTSYECYPRYDNGQGGARHGTSKD